MISTLNHNFPSSAFSNISLSDAMPHPWNALGVWRNAKTALLAEKNAKWKNRRDQDATLDQTADKVQLVIGLMNENGKTSTFPPFPVQSPRLIQAVRLPTPHPSLLNPHWQPKQHPPVLQESIPVTYTFHQFEVEDSTWGDDDDNEPWIFDHKQLLSEAEELEKFLDSQNEEVKEPTTMGESYSNLMKAPQE